MNPPADAGQRQAPLGPLPCIGIYSAVRDDRARIIDFRVEYVNEAVCRSNGLTREQQIGRQLNDVWPGHRESGLFGAYCEVVDTGRPFTRGRFEYTDLHRDPVKTRLLNIHIEKHGDGIVITWQEGPGSVPEVEATAQVLRESDAQHRELSARLRILLETTSHLIETLETDELLSSLLDLSGEMVAADAFGVWRMDEQRDWSIVASSGLSEEFLQESLHDDNGAGLPTEPVVVQPQNIAARSTPMLRDRWQRYEREGIRSLMILPLRIHGELSGTLVFYRRSPDCFADIDVESARALSNIAAAAITTSELYETQSRLRRRAEEAAMHEALLAAAGAILSESLDYEQTLANIASAAVPHFADWCAVDLLDEEGVLRRLTVAHVDPQKVAMVRELHEKYPPDDRRDAGALHVIRTGEPEMIGDIPDSFLVENARDENHLRILRDLHLTSYICVPLRSGATVCGAITFVVADSNRRFGEGSLTLGREIARRASHAIENARLYRNLRESEQRLQAVLDVLPLPLFIADATGRVYATNPAADEVWGSAPLSKQPDAYADDYKAWWPHSGKRVKSHEWGLARALATGEIVAAEEMEVERRDAQRRTILDYARPIRDGNGRIAGGVAVNVDITRQKQVEQALREREERYELVVAGAGGAIWDWDVPAKRVVFSTRWKELRGLSDDEVSDREEEWSSGIHPDDIERVMAAVRAHFEGRTPVFAEEYRVRHKDGRWIWILDRGIAGRDASGRVVRMAGSETDITERRQAEQALRESEERFRLATSAGKVGVWDWHVEHNTVTWSDTLYEIHGIEPENFTRDLDAFQRLVHPEDAARVGEAIRRALEQDDAYELEFRILRPDGEVRWVFTNATVVRDDQGRPRRMLGATVDVTERKQHEEHMGIVMAELNHRVKNTLAVIQSIAKQTIRRAPDFRTFMNGFEQRLRAIANAHSLLTKADWEGASLHEIITSEISSRVASEDQALISGPPTMLRPKAALAMHMVIHELTTNACKYGGLKSGAGRVDVEWSVEDGNEGNLQLVWIERCPHPVKEPAEDGYGSRLIEQLVRYELHGELRREVHPDGMHCRMRIPLSGSPAAPPGSCAAKDSTPPPRHVGDSAQSARRA